MKKLYEETDVQAVADAIREKNGSTDTYKVSEMAQAVKDIPTGDTSIEDGLIAGTLTEYSNSRVTTVAPSCFMGNRSLKKISLPNVVRYVPEQVFNSCSALVSIEMAKAYGLGTHTIYNCPKVTDISLPSLESVGYGSIRACAALTTLVLPMVNHIGDWAFHNDSSLVAVVLERDAVCVLTQTNAFTGTPIAKGTGYVYVPDNLVDSYKSATNWSTYADQIKPLSEYTGG